MRRVATSSTIIMAMAMTKKTATDARVAATVAASAERSASDFSNFSVRLYSCWAGFGAFSGDFSY